MSTPVAVVPGVPALLPSYAGIDDPVAGLRSACTTAVRWLVDESSRVVVLADPDSMRVARALLEDIGYSGQVVTAPQPGPVPDYEGAGLLVLANGSARRGERAPGHLDERSFGFDAVVAAALVAGNPTALADLDDELGEELLASGLPALRALRELGEPAAAPSVLYDDDPFGVQYWVVTWCAS